MPDHSDTTEEVIFTTPKGAPAVCNDLIVRANDRTVIYATEAGTIIKKFNADSPRGAELFRMEVGNLARLWREGVRCIPQLLDCGDLWFEMSNIPGGGITGLPAEIGVAVMLDIGRNILPTFQKHGYYYLDMKPSQIQLKDWQPCIVDHEHACFAGGIHHYYLQLGLGRTETFGTPTYMAPEVVSNDRDAIGHSTVVYSWAGTLIKIASGRTLFNHTGIRANLSAHLDETPKRPAEISSAFWDRVMLPALDKNARLRPAPAALAQLLKGFTAQSILGL